MQYNPCNQYRNTCSSSDPHWLQILRPPMHLSSFNGLTEYHVWLALMGVFCGELMVKTDNWKAKDRKNNNVASKEFIYFFSFWKLFLTQLPTILELQQRLLLVWGFPNSCSQTVIEYHEAWGNMSFWNLYVVKFWLSIRCIVYTALAIM